MKYPLREKIGNPDLLVGREKEFTNFGKWIANIPKCISKSRVILARRKSGKTALQVSRKETKAHDNNIS